MYYSYILGIKQIYLPQKPYGCDIITLVFNISVNIKFSINWIELNLLPFLFSKNEYNTNIINLFEKNTI